MHVTKDIMKIIIVDEKGICKKNKLAKISISSGNTEEPDDIYFICSSKNCS